VNREWVLEGDFREESGYRLTKELLLRRVRPSAVFVCNGNDDLGRATGRSKEMGVHYPDDLGLATFDDIAGDHSFHPRLTVVAQPTYEMGAQGATLLMDRIDGKAQGQTSRDSS